jgi:arylsulfatase A-like enzyme
MAFPENAPRPNVLVLLADDLGFADLSCYGHPSIRTPHLDRLAEQGVRFTDGYAGSATCSPTRLSLYTGRYPGRIEAGLHEPLDGDDAGLEPRHPTLASLLRDVGYRTAMVGKWHCGELPSYGPLKSGWEEFHGNYGGAVEYYSKLGTDGEPDLWEGETPVTDTRYYTSIVTERAQEFVGRAHDRPWLLNVNFTSAHWPWIAEGDTEEAARIARELRGLPAAVKKFALAHPDGGSLEKFREMVEGLDASIGALLQTLEDTGQAENTVVLFCSDNGGERYSNVWPFRGEKGELTEGGIRVPTLVRWPAAVAAGSTDGTPVFTPDWTATFLELAGAAPDPAHPLDGVSLVDHLTRGTELPERDLFWRQDGEAALRRGRWKFHRKHLDALYDLHADPHERANRARHEPELLAELTKAWESVDATLLPYPEKDGARS